MEPQNTPNSQNDLEQRKKSDGITIPDLNISQGFPIQDNIDWAYGSTERTMVPNRKPGTNSISTEKLISDQKKMPKTQIRKKIDFSITRSTRKWNFYLKRIIFIFKQNLKT